ncbi:MAG: deoxyuridine 5'-triphosphate nucleotidohydrolase [Bacilli bacterium]|nr:deoxyuridine 5'-triphosphate nucleotidohydrolase [Bacilli bacterium]
MSIAKFYKVSFEQFKKDWLDTLPTSKTEWTDSELKVLYNKIQIPTRSTKYSAGYDFKAYFPFELKVGETIKIPSGIRVQIDKDWFLAIVPRSGQGFKFRVQLDNTVGVIDSDYFGATNEGHMFVKLTNDGKQGKTMSVNENDGFAQGIFLPYGLAEESVVTNERVGGFGSTTTK